MTPEDQVIHLTHELTIQKGRTSRIASDSITLLTIALEAIEMNRLNVAKERIEVTIENYLNKLLYVP